MFYVLSGSLLVLQFCFVFTKEDKCTYCVLGKKLETNLQLQVILAICHLSKYIYLLPALRGRAGFYPALPPAALQSTHPLCFAYPPQKGKGWGGAGFYPSSVVPSQRVGVAVALHPLLVRKTYF